MHTINLDGIRSSSRRIVAVVIAAAIAASLLGACGPEDGRAVGGGLGADVGNHASSVPKSKVFGPTTSRTDR